MAALLQKVTHLDGTAFTAEEAFRLGTAGGGEVLGLPVGEIAPGRLGRPRGPRPRPSVAPPAERAHEERGLRALAPGDHRRLGARAAGRARRPSHDRRRGRPSRRGASSHARLADLTPESAMRFGFIPTEGGHLAREALTEVDRAEALGLDSVWMEEHHGVRGHYWPSPARRARGLRDSHLAHAPRHRRGGPALLRPGAGGRGRGDGGRAVGGPARVRRRHRVPAGRVRALPHAAREAGGAVRGGARRDPGALDGGGGHASRAALPPA